MWGAENIFFWWNWYICLHFNSWISIWHVFYYIQTPQILLPAFSNVSVLYVFLWLILNTFYKEWNSILWVCFCVKFYWLAYWIIETDFLKKCNNNYGSTLVLVEQLAMRMDYLALVKLTIFFNPNHNTFKWVGLGSGLA